MQPDLAGRIRRLFDGVWNDGEPGVADDLVAEDYTIHDRELAAELSGPTLYRALAEGTREVFPDAAFAIEDLLVDGDRVALRWEMTGSHEGSLFGEEPTGRAVTLPAIEIDHFDDSGLLAETWTRSDMLGLRRQVEE